MPGKYRTILIFGPPGSGKGTQGKVIGTLPGFHHLSCGDVFRSLNAKSELGRIFLQYSSQGKLVPDNFTIQLWRDYIQRQVSGHHFNPDEQIVILDGIPRNAPQAELMKEYIDVLLLVYLEARDQQKLVERLHRRALHENRLDDANEEVIRRRFSEYDAESKPVLEVYPKERIYKVDAGLSPLEVLEQIVAGVRKIA
ncbi:MAG: nucleoside monophosphate kinase [Candidatus Latescibacterota bacterium]|jgi:adenylate kinase